MTTKSFEQVITDAIVGAKPANPDAGEGVTYPRHFMAREEASHFAKVIVAALTAAGYEVVPKETDRPPAQ